MSISARATSVPRRLATPCVRCTSALLMTMSTLPAMAPASSLTERPLVRSSGTSVTCGSAAMASKPGSFFHGSAWPTQIRSAPAFASALHQRLADGGLAVGDQHLAELRVAAHLAQHRVVGHVRSLLVGEGDQHRLAGAVQPRADLDARGRVGHVAMQVQHQRGAGIQPHQAQPPGQALAEEQVVAVGQRGLAQQLALAALLAPLQVRWTGSGGRPRAAGTARRRSRRTPAARSGLRRRPRSCPARRGRAAPAAASAAACAGPGSCAWGASGAWSSECPRCRAAAAAARRRHPRSPAHIAGDRFLAARHHLINTSQAGHQPACRERGLRPRVPPPHCNDARCAPGRTPRAVAGRGVRVRGRRPRSRYAEPVPAWSVRTRQPANRSRWPAMWAGERGPAPRATLNARTPHDARPRINAPVHKHRS